MPPNPWSNDLSDDSDEDDKEWLDNTGSEVPAKAAPAKTELGTVATPAAVDGQGRGRGLGRGGGRGWASRWRHRREEPAGHAGAAAAGCAARRLAPRAGRRTRAAACKECSTSCRSCWLCPAASAWRTTPQHTATLRASQRAP